MLTQRDNRHALHGLHGSGGPQWRKVNEGNKHRFTAFKCEYCDYVSKVRQEVLDHEKDCSHRSASQVKFGKEIAHADMEVPDQCGIPRPPRLGMPYLGVHPKPSSSENKD